MNKALIITSVASMVDQFLLPSMFLLQDMGYEVHVACNFEKGSTCSEDRVEVLKRKLDSKSIKFYQIDFARNVTNVFEHMVAYRQLSEIIFENKFSLIHCHSPIGGLLGRLAARKARKKGARIFYTAHGFHFYKGAPLVNWLLYYPVEKLCARFTDTLITINKEDYELAKRKMKAKQVEYIPGVGIDVEKFKNTEVDRAAKRRELGIPEDAFLLVSVGELSHRKNHIVVLKALAQVENDSIHYVIVGKGSLLSYLEEFVKEKNIAHRVHFLGYREDVAEIYKASDVCCFPSLQEGLPVALMEAMASGLPVICSKIRGNVELVNDTVGSLVGASNIDEYVSAISQLRDDLELRAKFQAKALSDIESFDIAKILEQMAAVYRENSKF